MISTIEQAYRKLEATLPTVGQYRQAGLSREVYINDAANKLRKQLDVDTVSIIKELRRIVK